MRHPFRRKNASPRLIPFYIVAVLGVILANPTGVGLGFGLALASTGLALRAWGAGHLVKTDALVVSGPYAHLRHPLYAGTLLIGLGFGAVAGIAGLVVVVAFFLPVFVGYYAPYKERVESERLEARYGDTYREYHGGVRGFVPRLAAWAPPEGSSGAAVHVWSRQRFLDNDEHGTLLGVAAGFGILVCRAACV